MNAPASSKTPVKFAIGSHLGGAVCAALVLCAPTAALADPVEQPDQQELQAGEAPLPVEILAEETAKEHHPDQISTKLVWSQFADIPVSGDADSTLRYGGKIDGFVDVKGSAIGLDDSISIHIHPEFKYGESSNGLIGVLPASTQLFYPGDGDVFDLSVNITKRWNSGASLTVGKINVLDLATRSPIQRGGGHEGFQNIAVAIPPSAIVPASVTGAQLDVTTEDVFFRVIVYDPDLQSRRSGLEDPFSSGVGVLASATFPVKIGGKRGFYAIKLAGSTRDEIAADQLPPALVPAPGSGFGNGSGEFGAVFAFEQFLSEDAANPGNGIGIFGQLFVSTGDPTFLDARGFIGLGGNPKSRPQDRFGIAYFRYSLTDGLIEALQNRVAIEDEEGVEAYYTLGLSDTFRLTANIQAVDSGIATRKFGVTTGLRLSASF
ncbi:carbohydrate porin [Pontixanthobacter aquaemixtae]|uniref:Porin n=1 Tax=Pontixanthobacter aquaemixtae TaxID=1958940 RepID=A0A844ZXU7_9SPHN|nr:carbohydrate porin [Pontixanthobacter aquaemixtae]MXO91577.1 hypothetical protein [Pontixanthobacter aquaemixtae]